jgi:hypothetical protein
VLIIALSAACDGSPALPTATPALTGPGTPGVETGGQVVDAAPVTPPATPQESAPAPTEVTATGTGADLTALQALTSLKPRALAWQADARLGLLANVRPGRQSDLLGGALGQPDINEPTPGGRGRSWTLVAFSPSAHGAIALGMDGSQLDLVKEGSVTTEVVEGFAEPAMASLALSDLDPAKMVDSDKIAAQAGERGKAQDAGIALLAPNGLGLGPLPAPASGGEPPQVAYELFGGAGEPQSFVFYDAMTGAVVLDSAKP